MRLGQLPIDSVFRYVGPDARPGAFRRVTATLVELVGTAERHDLRDDAEIQPVALTEREVRLAMLGRSIQDYGAGTEFEPTKDLWDASVRVLRYCFLLRSPCVAATDQQGQRAELQKLARLADSPVVSAQAGWAADGTPQVRFFALLYRRSNLAVTGRIVE